MSASNEGSGWGILQVSVAGFLWSTGGLVVTFLHRWDGFDPMTVTAWRVAVAALTLVLVARITRRWRVVVATVRRHPRLVVVIGLGATGAQGFFYVSILNVGVGLATVIALAMAPILAAGAEHVLAGSRPVPREYAVTVLAVAGLVLISFSADHGSLPSDGSPAVGIVTGLAAGVSYALSTVIAHRYAKGVDTVALTTSSTVVSCVVLVPFLVIAGAQGRTVQPGSVGSWLLIVYAGVFTMALAYLLLYSGLRTTSGAAATIATLVEPVSAALLALLLLGEKLSWLSVVGGLMILAAVVALHPRDQDPAPL